MSETNTDARTELVQRMADELNDGNVEALDEILAPDYVIHLIGEDDLDREGYKALCARHREEAENLTQTVETVIVQDDRVANRTRLTGESDGEEGEIVMMQFHRVEDGRIVESWETRNWVTEPPEEYQ